MKLKGGIPCRSVSAIFMSLFFIFVLNVAARAQTVIPTVCVTPNARTGTTTVTTNAAVGQSYLYLDTQNNTLPLTIRIIVNPGGATEETFLFASPLSSGNTIYYYLRSVSGSNFRLVYAHNAGETVRWFTDTTATFGYNNTSGSEVVIPKGLPAGNYFSPGITTYPQQTTTFQPGIHNNAFSIDLPTLGETTNITWFVDGGQAKVSSSTLACATITYQGRLSDAGAAATGAYDLQFTAYDQLIGGAAQSETIVVENAAVTNGIFTVQLNFAASFYNNDKARYLEIGVRPGTSTGAFTVLTPRQLLTKVPFAVNADIATTATNVSGGFVQLPLTSGAPPATECDEAREYGRQKVDAANARLYVCTPSGWKYTVLQ